MESPRLVSLRAKYLNSLYRHVESGTRVVYLDETWYDTHDVKCYGFQDDSGKCKMDAPVSRGKRIIIIHAGCKDGWIDGCLSLSAKQISNSSADYQQDMNAEVFEDWFLKTL